jgi:hypothetical protein
MSEDSNQIQSLYAIPFIERINQELTHLDTWWTAVSLVGKVNHQDVGGHFLQTLSEAQEQFQALRRDFVHQLAQITQQNINTTLSLRAQALVDLLFRNLFERTADVAFLAQDPTVAELCCSEPNSNHPYLETYCKLYTVYQNVAIFNDQLVLIASAHNINTQKLDQSKLSAALTQSTYCEWHAPSMTIHNATAIYYAHVIEHEGQKQGVLLLEFNLQAELDEIESFLTRENTDYRLGLLSKEGDIWNKHKLNAHATLTIEKNRISLSKSFASFQGYMGLPWRASASLSISHVVSNNEDNGKIRLNSTLFPSGLYQIQKLSDFSLLLVILNGKIISLQRNAQAFLPILEDFQRIGKSINGCLSSTIGRIFMLNYDRIQTETRFSSQLAAEFFSRSFYERANDCRWWALNQSLIQNISQAQYAVAAEVLTNIHQLYTVYKSLVIYNLSGDMIANSQLNTGLHTSPDHLQQDMIARLEPLNYLAIAHTDSDNQDTFSFYAPIRTENEVSAIMSITFDTEAQLAMMLTDVLPKQSDGQTNNAWAAFATEHSIIAHTTHTPDSIKHHVWQQLGSQHALAMGETKLLEVHIDDQLRCIAITRCAPYREFLQQTGFSTPIFAIVGQTI